MPLVGTGADPERLGSPGTAKTPQIMARRSGNKTANTSPNQSSNCFQAQIPTEISTATSSRKRIKRLIGLEGTAKTC